MLSDSIAIPIHEDRECLVCRNYNLVFDRHSSEMAFRIKLGTGCSLPGGRQARHDGWQMLHGYRRRA